MDMCNQSFIEDDNTRRSYIEDSVFVTEEQFNKAVKQIEFLNHKIQQLQIRYRRKSCRRNGLHYSLRLQIATFEGVRCVFYRYAEKKACLLDRLYSYNASEQPVHDSDNLNITV